MSSYNLRKLDHMLGALVWIIVNATHQLVVELSQAFFSIDLRLAANCLISESFLQFT